MHLILNEEKCTSWSEKGLSSDMECHEALISLPIIRPPNWKFPFETMCDAYDHAVGPVPVQCKDNAISYASKTLTGVHDNGEGTFGTGICH